MARKRVGKLIKKYRTIYYQEMRLLSQRGEAATRHKYRSNATGSLTVYI
ncbi:hypothetical protein A464_2550 [Salmonella bongori N268-08]|uniref:Uncharacterized protein n=1 Tax=Salmonella bongori N268-08 TaxID=1197719 RepID=S5NAU9_SALBN|nr:hypothetical protein A464_2550 [Salmonella bongori N268-08]